MLQAVQGTGWAHKRQQTTVKMRSNFAASNQQHRTAHSSSKAPVRRQRRQRCARLLRSTQDDQNYKIKFDMRAAPTAQSTRSSEVLEGVRQHQDPYLGENTEKLKVVSSLKTGQDCAENMRILSSKVNRSSTVR